MSDTFIFIYKCGGSL